MGSITGQIIMCDRCRQQKFYETGKSYHEDFVDVEIDNGCIERTLCKPCHDIYLAMIKSFWQGFYYDLPGVNEQED